MDEVLWLEDAENVLFVGGKAASLGNLLREGFNVPRGFVITTKAKTKMTKELKAKIIQHFDELGVKKVAVRSSVVAEDGVNDAWAGQFDTFLNIELGGLIEAVEKCWLSAGSDRAKSYAQHKGLQSGGVAVIIQKMVPATISGVAFSVHPVTRDPGQMVIEAAEGLADKLVSGEITPDTYVIDKGVRDVLESHLSAQNQILAKDKLEKLVQEIIKIEQVYGFPVDVEWSYTNEELFILQSRPITTLG